ncbi:S41 family peptidase [Clostridium sp. DL1XJH146]
MKNKDGKSRFKKINIIILVLIIVLSNMVTYVVSSQVSFGGSVKISKATYDELMKFEKLFIVKANIENKYDGEIDEDALVDGAIKGMTNALGDPYTVYYNEEDYKKFNETVTGSYEGVGLQVGVKDNKIVVITTFEDSPAQKAGIRAGDVIVKVEDVAVSGTELDNAVSMMKGEKGTAVSMTLYRESTGEYTVSVERDEIKLTTVTGQMLDDEIGYISISIFENKTSDEFKSKLKELEDQGMKGLVLDIRQNPGGWLTECVDISSQFVPKGDTIVSTIDKYDNEKVETSKGGIAIGMPLVVLIDGNSASASEIFSGVVRDYELGTLIGENTFGKGIVQTVLDKSTYGFGDGTALKVTTSKYYTPNGENIHKIGIAPDIEVKYPDELREEEYSRETDPQFQKALEEMNNKLN